jgi:hypothetical protein
MIRLGSTSASLFKPQHCYSGVAAGKNCSAKRAELSEKNEKKLDAYEAGLRNF